MEKQSIPTNKNFIWNIVVVAIFIVLFALQFVTGASQFSLSTLSSIITIVLAIFFVRWFKSKRADKFIKDERVQAVGAKSNGMTLFWVIMGGLIVCGLATAFTPYFPALKIVAATLLCSTIAASLLNRIFYWWYDRKMS